MNLEVKKLRLALRNKDDELKILEEENYRLRCLVWYWQERNMNLERELNDKYKGD